MLFLVLVSVLLLVSSLLFFGDVARAVKGGAGGGHVVWCLGRRLAGFAQAFGGDLGFGEAAFHAGVIDRGGFIGVGSGQQVGVYPTSKTTVFGRSGA